MWQRALLAQTLPTAAGEAGVLPTANPSDVQSNGHDEIEETSVITRLNQPRAEWADQLQDEVVRLGALQALPEEVRVEADFECLSLEGHRQRLAGLSDIRRLSRDVERSLGESQ